MDVEQAVMIRYCYRMATTRALYKSTNGLDRLRTDNSPA